MQESALKFLKDLLTSPGPSGYEEPIQKVVRAYAKNFAAEVTTDYHGNVTAVVNPGGSPRIMLAGHCDQIGLQVKHVNDNGFIYVDTIGGWDVQMLIGQRLQVWTKNGPVTGVIARKAIHLLNQAERTTVPEIKDLWLDIGTTSREETLSVVELGDPVTLDLGFHELRNNLACAAGMDDRVGVWVVMSALERVAKANPKAAVYAVSTVQEEIGLRGAKTSAYTIDPQLGIAVDVTHATDVPGVDENQYGRVKLNKGPVLFRGPNVNHRVFDRLKALAGKHDIPVQPMGISRAASNDGNVLQTSRGGLATGIIGIPNRYMHSPVEVISLTDIDHAAELIAQFCLTLTKDCDFTP